MPFEAPAGIPLGRDFRGRGVSMIAWLLDPARRGARGQALPARIEIAGRSVPLVVREHHAARRLILRVSPTGEVRVTVPPRTRPRTILDFLARHQGWASERLARRPANGTVADGAVVPLRGVPTRIEHRREQRGSVILDVAGEAVLRIGGDPAFLKRRVREALKREALGDLSQAVARHAAAAKVTPAGIQIRDTRSRWGSCSTTRRLSFSFRIVMAPPMVLDYLAAHEVAHLAEMNHGPAFWALCRRLCPQMDAGRDWLRVHGALLHAIDFR